MKSARALAVNVIMQILDEGAYGNIALRAAFLGAEPDMRERRLTTEIVNETLRNLIYIDTEIDAVAATKTPKMKPRIRAILRTAACQILFMPRIPARAAVNEAVFLAKKSGFGRLAGFVNAVLRAVARAAGQSKDTDNPALRYSYPPELLENLETWLGDDLENFLKASHNPPSTTILVNILHTTPEELARILEKEGIAYTPFNSQFLILSHPGDLTRLKAWRDGLFLVMDPAAYHAVEAMAPQPGERIYDLCAAPGGKTFAAAIAMQNHGEIKAFDIHPHKIDLLKEGIARLKLPIIHPAAGDATEFNPALPLADAILLDAPCSGFGTLRKHPEIKYKRTLRELTALPQKQLTMLNTAAQYLKPGGRLVYSTCTVARPENEEVIARFLSANPKFSLLHSRLYLPTPNTDGFFIAKIQHK